MADETETETETETKEIDAFITHESSAQTASGEVDQVPATDGDAADTEDDSAKAEVTGEDEDEDEDEAEDSEDGGGEAEDASEAPEDGADEEPEDLDGEEKPSPKKKNAKTRIAELTKSRRQAERKTLEAQERNAALEQRLSDLENRLTKGKEGDNTEDVHQSEQGKPNPEDFRYGEVDPAYTEALTSYLVEKKLDTVKAKNDEKQQTEAAEQVAKELKTQYNDKITEGVTAYEDFEEVVVARADRNDFPLTQETAMMALESPVGHHVLYAIAKDKALADKISKMSPASQGREFGRLEAQYQPDGTPPPTQKNKSPKAQPPHTKGRGSGGKVRTDVVNADFMNFEKIVMAEQRHKDKQR